MSIRLAIVLLLTLLLPVLPAKSSSLTPQWQLPGPYQVATTDEVWHDPVRARDIPVQIYSPIGAPGKLPVVIFSHGLGGSRIAGETWGRQWASWGIVSVHLQHAGSDSSIIFNGTGTLLDRLKSAMTPEQLIARCKDVSFAATEIGKRMLAKEPALSQVDVNEIGMSGHSFGAQTTLAIAGQKFDAALGAPFADSRFKAYIAFSPSARGDADLDLQFNGITAPFLSLTGSQDQLALTPEITPESRTLAFKHMAPGHKYLAWLDTAAHMSFGGQTIPRLRSPQAASALGEGFVPPNQTHINVVVKGVTTAFWLAYLEPTTVIGRAAKSWLTSDGPKALMVTGDRWETR